MLVISNPVALLLHTDSERLEFEIDLFVKFKLKESLG